MLLRPAVTLGAWRHFVKISSTHSLEFVTYIHVAKSQIPKNVLKKFDKVTMTSKKAGNLQHCQRWKLGPITTFERILILCCAPSLVLLLVPLFPPFVFAVPRGALIVGLVLLCNPFSQRQNQFKVTQFPVFFPKEHTQPKPSHVNLM